MSATSYQLAAGSTAIRQYVLELSQTPRTVSLRIEKVVVPESKQPALDLSWSWDGKHLASATPSAVYITDRQGSYEDIRKSTDGDLRAVAFQSKDTRFLAYGGSTQELVVWDREKDTAHMQLKISKPISSISWSADDQRLAAGYGSGILMCSLGTRTHKTIPAFNQSVTTVMFSRLRKSILAAAGDDGAAAYWDLDKGDRPIHTFNSAHKSPITGLSFSPSDKDVFCTVGLDQRVCCYNISLNRVTVSVQIDYPIKSCSMARDNLIALGTMNGTILIFDTDQQAVIFSTTALSDEGPVNAISFSPVMPNASVGALVGNKANIPIDTRPKSKAPLVPTNRPVIPRTTRDDIVQSEDFMAGFSPVKTSTQLANAKNIYSKPLVREQTKNSTGQARRNASAVPQAAPESRPTTRQENDIPLKQAPGHTAGNELRQLTAHEQTIDPIFSPPSKAVGRALPKSPESPTATKVSGNERISMLDRLKTRVDTGQYETKGPSGNMKYLQTSRSMPQMKAGGGKILQSTVTGKGDNKYTIFESSGSTSRKEGQTPSVLPTSKGGTSPSSEGIWSRGSHTSTNGDSANVTETIMQSTASILEKTGFAGISEKMAKEVAKVANVNGQKGDAPDGRLEGRTGRKSERVQTDVTLNNGALQPQSFQYQVLQNVVNDCLEDFRAQLRADVQNMHLDMLRQFWVQKTEIEELLREYSPNVEMMEELRRLRQENERLRCNY